MNSEREEERERVGVSEGDLPVICELYVGYIDVHGEAALAASSSFKLILNGIRSGCHNPQDQQQQRGGPYSAQGGG